MAKMKKTTTCDAKIAELKALQAIIDRRTEIENEAIALISQCRFEEAMQLLDTIPEPFESPELPDEEASVQEEVEELEKTEEEDTQCIMPEMPYCPCCQHGYIVSDLDDDTYCTWYCLLESEVQHGKKE